MHSRIFEITSKPLDRDDYLTSDWLEYHQIYDFADYISDDVCEDEDIEWFAEKMSHIFACDGRKVILRDISGFIELWKADVRKKASEFDPKNDGMSSHHLRMSVNETHEDISFRFYNEDYGLMNMRRFIENVLLYHKPGDVFYIGGIVDFHC